MEQLRPPGASVRPQAVPHRQAQLQPLQAGQSQPQPGRDRDEQCHLKRRNERTPRKPAVKLSKSRRESLATEHTFFTRNEHRMDYARFRRNGWPIGSGPVEAACKSVVKTRLCRSGMRWSRCGGQHILSLRTNVESNRWDDVVYVRIPKMLTWWLSGAAFRPRPAGTKRGSSGVGR